MSRQAPSSASMLLLRSIKVGRYDLPHRMVMAPLTRSRAGQPGDIPTSLNARYYTQRASAALIISEASQISQQGQGYASTPGMYTNAQVRGWRRVIDSVHRAGGRMFAQLWHVGRISHPSYQPKGERPVAPSAIRPAGRVLVPTRDQQMKAVPYVTPRALGTLEMPSVVQEFKHAAENALSAGFDGVEVHAANGYLLDQFLNSTTNRRTDMYGGSLPNRVRLLLAVVQAVTSIWGVGRVGVRISPLGVFNDISDANPKATFGHVVDRLNEYDLAYLHVVRRFTEATSGAGMTRETTELMRSMRRGYCGRLIVAGGFTFEEAERWVASGRADLIAFGRKFLANPDLPVRLRLGAPLNPEDPATFYGGDENGYTDYPALGDAEPETYDGEDLAEIGGTIGPRGT